LRAAVADPGPGVAEADRQRIFDPSVTQRPDGTGLGLAIVRRIVSDHGGGVATSAAGGAWLTVVLPSSGGR
jgi:two-component system sensor histidine kinase HydH